jgi:uncharacterized protein (DUF1499 family)
MHKFLLITALLALLFVLYLAVQGYISRSGQGSAGLLDGRLSPCPDKPNCVCSEYPADSSHYIDPFDIGELSVTEAMQAMQRVITDLGGRIETGQDDYLAAVFTSALFGFTDDVEVRIEPAEKVIHIRSASRVGTSDLGANRKRVETVRQRFRQQTE